MYDKIMNIFYEIVALEAEKIVKSVIIGCETQGYHQCRNQRSNK